MKNQLTQHHLIAELITDEYGDAIMLKQQEDSCSDAETILVHPWQLRTVCEQLDIIPSDQQSAKTIAALSRKLCLLNDRINHLAYFLANHSDTKHADLSYEQTYARATAELADEFVKELAFDADTLCADKPPTKTQGKTKQGQSQLELDA